MQFNLLFVDDEQDILNAYKSIFSTGSSEVDQALKLLDDPLESDHAIQEERDNYVIFTANQGSEAIEIVQRQQELGDPIQILFTDMRMPPGINGSETAKAIREIDPRIEVVLVTAFSDSKLDKIAKDIGANDKLLYLRKPFDRQEIIQITRNLTHKYINERAKDNLLKNISHEFKTPITVISGFSKILLESIPSDSENKEFVEHIDRNVELVLQQMNGLIAATEYGNTQVVLERVLLNKNELMKLIRHHVEPVLKQSELAYEIHTPLDESFQIFVDPLRLAQALQAILSNAIKFTPEGQVNFGLMEHKGYLSITCSDTGIGIEQDQIEKMTSIFERGETQHHHIPGLGLGLFITDQFAKLSGGRLKITNNEERGSTIRLILPCQPGANHDA